MSTESGNGGPAFPNELCLGMSIKDAFFMAALSGLLAHEGIPGEGDLMHREKGIEKIVGTAWVLADKAMSDKEEYEGTLDDMSEIERTGS
jgi:hypothetical protein